MFCIPKILKNESNSQQFQSAIGVNFGCFVSQRYWKMKAIHNFNAVGVKPFESCFVSQRYWKMKAIHNTLYGNIACHCVVLYPKDTEKWKQFTTEIDADITKGMLFCIPKILKNESNSQLILFLLLLHFGCFVSQRYWKMKAIHNCGVPLYFFIEVVLYPKDTEKWKQFTTYLQKNVVYL